MKTFPQVDERTARTVGFEIENVYVSPAVTARVLSEVDGVSEVRKRRPFSRSWDEIHVRFQYRGVECVVWEPFGDNSMYWIGQKDAEDPIDVSSIEIAFKAYRPPFVRRVVGDLLSLKIPGSSR